MEKRQDVEEVMKSMPNQLENTEGEPTMEDRDQWTTFFITETTEKAEVLRKLDLTAAVCTQDIENLLTLVPQDAEVVLVLSERPHTETHPVLMCGIGLWRGEVNVSMVQVDWEEGVVPCDDQEALQHVLSCDKVSLPLGLVQLLPSRLGVGGWDVRLDLIFELILPADVGVQEQVLAAIEARVSDLHPLQLSTAFAGRKWLFGQFETVEKQDEEAQGLVKVAIALCHLWVLDLLRLGNKANTFFEWVDGAWWEVTVQQFCKRMGVAHRSSSFIRSLCHHLGMLSQVQGLPNAVDQFDKVALRNGTFDFSDGALRPVQPEDKMIFRLERSYLSPEQRLPMSENGFYRVLNAYGEEVKTMICQSMMPRVVGPWPGGKHINLVGLPGTGKNKLILLLKRLVANNVCSIDVGSRHDRHANSRLVNMFMNYSNEGKRTRIHNMESWKDDADDRNLEVNPKMKAMYATRRMCTPVHAMNLMYLLPSVGSEFWRRMLIIPFTRRLKGMEGGDDFIDRVIDELTDLELDSAWSDAADIAVQYGPDGVYPADLTQDEVSALYEELVDPFQMFLQSELRWTDSKEPLLFKDIIQKYQESEYSIVDRKTGKRDDQGCHAMNQKIRNFCGATGGYCRRERTESCHDGVQAVVGLAWGKGNLPTSNILGRFTKVQEDVQETVQEDVPAEAAEPKKTRKPRAGKADVEAGMTEAAEPKKTRKPRASKAVVDAEAAEAAEPATLPIRFIDAVSGNSGESQEDQLETAPIQAHDEPAEDGEKEISNETF